MFQNKLSDTLGNSIIQAILVFHTEAIKNIALLLEMKCCICKFYEVAGVIPFTTTK